MKVYSVFAFVVAFGAFALQVALGPGAFSYILFFMAATYWVTAPLVYRQAAKLVQAASAGS
jgi:hypothetical protein